MNGAEHLKKEIIPGFVGPGSHAQNRLVFQRVDRMLGEIKRTARYLGARYHVKGATFEERGYRLKAANQGYAVMGKYWCTGSSLRMRIVVFKAMCLVNRAIRIPLYRA